MQTELTQSRTFNLCRAFALERAANYVQRRQECRRRKSPDPIDDAYNQYVRTKEFDDLLLLIFPRNYDFYLIQAFIESCYLLPIAYYESQEQPTHPSVFWARLDEFMHLIPRIFEQRGQELPKHHLEKLEVRCQWHGQPRDWDVVYFKQQTDEVKKMMNVIEVEEREKYVLKDMMKEAPLRWQDGRRKVHEIVGGDGRAN